MFPHAQEAASTYDKVGCLALGCHDNVLDVAYFVIILVVHGLTDLVLYAPTADGLGAGVIRIGSVGVRCVRAARIHTA